jgi:glycerophosphoryl diester phosphodiesterase
MKTLNLPIIILIVLLLSGCVVTKAEDPFLVIAHRGDSGQAPEHTFASYNRAVELGADYIEIDLRLTKDNHLIAFHDETVERTTNGKGAVRDLTLERVKKLDAGSWFDSSYKDEKVPTLEEIFERYGNDENYYIETEVLEGSLVMEKQLVSLIEEYNLEDNVVIQSFFPESLKEVKKLNNKLPLVLLLEKETVFTKEKINEWNNYLFAVAPTCLDLNERIVSKLHSSDLKIHPFFPTKSEKEEIKRMIDIGVDGVFTNHVEYTKSLNTD